MSEFPTSQSRICSIVCGATPVASIRGLFNDLPRRIVLYLQGLWGPVSISATGTGHSPWQLQCGWLIIAGMKFLRPDLADQASERARIIQVVVARGHCDVVWARNIPDGIKAARDDAEMEPVLGFEPRTDGLQNRCSTTELNWPGFVTFQAAPILAESTFTASLFGAHSRRARAALTRRSKPIIHTI